VFRGVSPPRKVQVGDRVTATQGLVTIPEVDRMLVESSVAESQVHRVGPGQPARVTLDAFPDLVIEGRVQRVGTLARSAQQPFEAKRFDLIVELSSCEAELRPEMTARVSVVAEERRGVLRVPLNAVFFRDEAAVVHVVHTFGIETRAIELGASDEAFGEVTSGLQEGDRLLLRDLDGRGAAEAHGEAEGMSILESLRGSGPASGPGPQ